MSGHIQYNELQDDELPEQISKQQMLTLLDTMVKEIFLDAFEQAFGEPSDFVKNKVQQAHIAEVKEWIPNLVNAKDEADVFVSSLERSIAKFAAGVVNRNCDGDIKISDIRKPQDILNYLRDKK